MITGYGGGWNLARTGILADGLKRCRQLEILYLS